MERRSFSPNHAVTAKGAAAEPEARGIGVSGVSGSIRDIRDLWGIWGYLRQQHLPAEADGLDELSLSAWLLASRLFNLAYLPLPCTNDRLVGLDCCRDCYRR